MRRYLSDLESACLRQTVDGGGKWKKFSLLLVTLEGTYENPCPKDQLRAHAVIDDRPYELTINLDRELVTRAAAYAVMAHGLRQLLNAYGNWNALS